MVEVESSRSPTNCKKHRSDHVPEIPAVMIEVGQLIPKTSLETSTKAPLLGFAFLSVASAFQLDHVKRHEDMLRSCHRGHLDISTELKVHDR